MSLILGLPKMMPCYWPLLILITTNCIAIFILSTDIVSIDTSRTTLNFYVYSNSRGIFTKDNLRPLTVGDSFEVDGATTSTL